MPGSSIRLPLMSRRCTFRKRGACARTRASAHAKWLRDKFRFRTFRRNGDRINHSTSGEPDRPEFTPLGVRADTDVITGADSTAAKNAFCDPRVPPLRVMFTDT